MPGESVSVTLGVEGAADSDQQELDQLTAQLRSRLLELDVDDVEPLRGGDIPPGARPVDPITVGALVVTLVPPLLEAVVSLVRSWMEQRHVGGVTLTIGDATIDLKEASDEERARLVQMFVEQHQQS